MIDWIVEMGISVKTVEDNGPKMAAVTAMDEIVTDYEEENGFQKPLESMQAVQDFADWFALRWCEARLANRGEVD